VESFFAAAMARARARPHQRRDPPDPRDPHAPVTLLTLGLFLFVINALLFWFVAEIVQGFHVDGFLAALIGSILYSLGHPPHELDLFQREEVSERR
jgi:hypothetical protein